MKRYGLLCQVGIQNKGISHDFTISISPFSALRPPICKSAVLLSTGHLHGNSKSFCVGCWVQGPEFWLLVPWVENTGNSVALAQDSQVLLLLLFGFMALLAVKQSNAVLLGREAKTKHTPPWLDWKLGKRKTPPSWEMSRPEGVPVSAMHGNGISLPTALKEDIAYLWPRSAIPGFHAASWGSWISQLHNPTSKVVGGRERGCQAGIYCAFPLQGQGSLLVAPQAHHCHSFSALISLSLTLTLTYPSKAGPLLLEMTGHFNLACLGNRQSQF